MSFVISSGHGKYIRGASGKPCGSWGCDEVDEARKVVEKLAEYLRSVDVGVVTYHDNQSTTQSENLNRIVNFHNSHTRDYDISVHFNAYECTSSKNMGVEVLYVTQQSLASEVSLAIADAGDFTNRGAKKRTDLAFLNNTNKPAILIETCFCDAKIDCDLYRQNFDEICRAIAEALSDTTIIDDEPERPERPGRPPDVVEPAEGIVARVPPNDQLNIRASGSSSATVIGGAMNGDHLTLVARSGSWLKCSFTVDEVTVYGWVSDSYVDVIGEVPPVSGGWHEDITATQFGGGGDEQQGAYGNYITGSTRGVALPYKWRDSPRPRVIVQGPKGNVTCDIVDVGPWNIDDPDYVLGEARPMVEEQYENGTEAQNGQVPTSDAAIDLTDPIAREVGISGKGKVRWRFEEDVS